MGAEGKHQYSLSLPGARNKQQTCQFKNHSDVIFFLLESNEYILVDMGSDKGTSGAATERIQSELEKSNIHYTKMMKEIIEKNKISHIFISHADTDHINIFENHFYGIFAENDFKYFIEMNFNISSMVKFSGRLSYISVVTRSIGLIKHF